MRIKYLLVLILILPVFLTELSAQPLPEGKWRLSAYNFSGKISKPLDGLEITLNINPEGKLGGKSGCNTYGGSWEFIDGNLKISDIFSTKMFCDAESNMFESDYYDLLSKTKVFSIEKGKLTLTDPKSLKFLEFTRVQKKKIAVVRDPA